jgi:hypothetical protein
MLLHPFLADDCVRAKQDAIVGDEPGERFPNSFLFGRPRKGALCVDHLGKVIARRRFLRRGRQQHGADECKDRE